tara:strand:- start:270 stop:1622 length:1353 start_codon:yes stop_codon:yes gene_type:complete
MRKINSSLKMRKVLFLSASFLLSFYACKKDGEINPEFAQDTSSAFFTDSLNVTSRTVIGDSVLADRISTGLVGSFKDSVFGSSYASTTFQPLLPSNFLVFGETNETLTTDSVVLSLEYSGMRGDTVPQQFLVHRVNEILNTSNDYPSNYQIDTIVGAIGTRTIVPRIDKEFYVLNPDANGNIDSVLVDPQLRIRLDNAIGDEILSQSGMDPVANSSNFIEFFKGLTVSSNRGMLNNNEKAIVYFALTSSNTKMSVYYTATDDQGVSTKKVVDFPVNSSSVRFNNFKHDYSQGSINNVLQTSQNDSLFSYVQAMAGVRTLIQFPGIENLVGKNIIINKAELELPYSSGSYDAFGIASRLIVAAKDQEGTLQFIPDYFEGTTYFGGDYSSSSQSYKFNITRYIQGIINQSITDKELTVLISGSAVNADRVVLSGASNLNQRIKLNLYYSNTQ